MPSKVNTAALGIGSSSGGSGGSGTATLTGALPAGSNTIGNVGIVGTVPVSGTFFPGSQPVTGTFWQATQPVSLSALPALPTGANTIGAVNVNGTIPVSGSFYQATQPVSGTFWQATQPVSLAALPALPTGANTIGAVNQAGVWTVAVSGTPNVNITNAVVTIQGYKAAGTAGNVTTAASVIGPFAVPNTGALTASVQGTYAGVNVSFLASPDGGATWYGVAGSRTDTGISEFVSGVLPANTGRAWDFLCGGATHFKIVASAWTSGTASFQINPHAFAVDPAPSVIAQGAIAAGSPIAANPVPMGGSDGTNVRNILTDATGRLMTNMSAVGGANIALGVAASAAALPVTMASDQNDLSITGAATQSAAGNNIMLAAGGTTGIDTVGGYPTSFRSFYCQVNGSAGISSGAVTFQGSNDNVNWVTLTVFDDAVGTGAPIQAAISIAASTYRFFSGKTAYRYLKCNITTVFAGGTIQAFTRLSTSDLDPRLATVNQPTAANLQTTATIASGTVTTVGTVAAITAGPAIASGFYNRITDGVSMAAVKAASTAPLATDPALNATISPNVASLSQYSVLAAATTNAAAVKATPGKIFSLSLNNYATSARYVRLYNLAVAPTVGTSTPYSTITIPASGSKEIEFGLFGSYFSTGIGIAITAAATDLDATVCAAGDVRVLINYL